MTTKGLSSFANLLAKKARLEWYYNRCLDRCLDRVTKLVSPLANEYVMFRRMVGYFPHIRNPRSFNEKISHRKFFKPVPSDSMFADKFLVREFVQARGHSNILTKVSSYTTSPDELNFAKLPSQFVIKATHASGRNLIVPNKNEIDRNLVVDLCRTWMSAGYGQEANEFHYQKVTPAIMVEELLVDKKHGIPLDYKFFVFHGKCHFIQVDYDRFSSHSRRFYDRNWKPMNFTCAYPLGPIQAKPKMYEEMVSVAESLGKDFDFVRVDLYAVDDRKIYFGELTLTPHGARGAFGPTHAADFLLGSLW